jgi:CMP-N,N'-diacetyllegionaminic acid synthase
MNILAFIPARGGSKGIHRKNLVEVAGKPLLYYSLSLVKKLGSLVLPFVSTDDDEILNYCSTQGFKTDYKRPVTLALDHSLLIDAVWDAIGWYEAKHDMSIDAVLLLQPTTPLRFESEVKKAIEQFKQNKLNSLVSVTPVREHPYECMELNDSGWAYLKKPLNLPSGRQDYQDNFYFIDGSFYLADVNFLRREDTFVKEGETQPFFLKRTWAVDIDVPDDLMIAETFLRPKEACDEK